jgi:hypothetical protein
LFAIERIKKMIYLVIFAPGVKENDAIYYIL